MGNYPMTPEIARLVAAAEELIAFRESEQGLSWEEFRVKQAAQHEEMRLAIRGVKEPTVAEMADLFADR